MTKPAALAPASALAVGEQAPEFTMKTHGDKTIRLSDLKGKKVVLYFYPKDDTPGCTVEAKDFSALKPQFDKANTVIVGVSKDSVASHDKFRDKFCLTFDLGADDTNVCESYGVWGEKSMYGKKYMGIHRATFLIDEQGIIQAIWPKVKVEGHADEVLKATKSL